MNSKRANLVRSWYLANASDNFRNSLRMNPEVLFQSFASQISLIKCMRKVEGEIENYRVLDVGCGRGGNLYQFVRLGFLQKNIFGIDIREEEIKFCKEVNQVSNFFVCDGSKIGIEDNSIDIVYESTMFATLPDDNQCRSIASEMIRICKPGGYILLVDWRINKPMNNNYNALTKIKLKNFFCVDSATSLITCENGALIPPLGRFLSKYCSPIYFLVGFCFPFLVGQVAYLLKKIK